MTDQKNTILAIVLSALVLIGWQIFYGMPQMEKQKQLQQQQQQQQQAQPQPPAAGTSPQAPAAPATPGAAPATAPPAPGQPAAAQTLSREAAIAATPRVGMETPSLSGSLSLKRGRIDDLSLVKYRETVDPNSPAVVLLSPSGSPHPFYAEYGWAPPSGATLKLPSADTIWQQEGSGVLAP